MDGRTSHTLELRGARRIFSYVLKVLELRDLYIVRPCVRARVRRPPKSVILARLSNISENDPRKTQYLSAGIVINPTLLTTFFCELS